MGAPLTAGPLAVGNDRRPMRLEGTARPAATSHTADDTEEIR
ncbi:hypothetical protein [Streptomyces sp. NPDC021969]